ncbi:MAG: OprD family porin [Epsilonproteobacteria bacterium]|nr:OprD family porin [Campylobacterota bacterium]
MKPFSTLLLTAAVTLPLAAGESTTPVEITTVRGVLSKVEPLEHTTGQIRAGYIDLKMNRCDSHNNAFAVGGHVHLNSKRWQGMMVGVEGYFVEDLGLQSNNPDKVNGDFFDKDKEGFATLSQAFIDGKWGNTEIKIGRQMIDTPHADSDDIRMMPNYFTAYLLINTDCEGLTLTLGQIDQMAGWENGVDAKKFVPVEKTLGSDKKTDGIYLVSAVYKGFEKLTLQAWYYDIDDIANVIYLEAGYELPTDWATLTFGVQYDTAKERGDEVLGDIDSRTWGVSVETAFENGLTLLTAYNADHGDTGAFGSLGGGPFFTSLEDQTLDAVGQKGDAWIAGAGYDLAGLGLEGLNMGVVYGRFAADKTDDYETAETDIALKYVIGERFTATLAYALIDDKTDADEDYEQFRVILNYNFKAL